jgi:hypothetical protein
MRRLIAHHGRRAASKAAPEIALAVEKRGYFGSRAPDLSTLGERPFVWVLPERDGEVYWVGGKKNPAYPPAVSPNHGKHPDGNTRIAKT